MEKENPAIDKPQPNPSADASGTPPIQGTAQPQSQQNHPGNTTGEAPKSANQQQPQNPTANPTGTEQTLDNQQQQPAGNPTGVAPGQDNQQQNTPVDGTGASPTSPQPQTEQPVRTQEIAQPNDVEQQRPSPTEDATGKPKEEAEEEEETKTESKFSKQPWYIKLGLLLSGLRIFTYFVVVIIASVELNQIKTGKATFGEDLFWVGLVAGGAFIFFEFGVMFGLWYRSDCMTKTSLVVSIISLIVFLAVMAIAILIAKSAKDPLDRAMLNEMLVEYFSPKVIPGTDERKRDRFQREHECCGFFGPADYERSSELDSKDERLVKRYIEANGTVPGTCYPSGKREETFTDGCLTSVLDTHFIRGLKVAVAAGILNVQLIAGIIVTMTVRCCEISD